MKRKPKIISRSVDKKRPRRGYACPECERKEKLYPGRHWCCCDAETPYEMEDVAMAAIVQSAVSEAFATLIRKRR